MWAAQRSTTRAFVNSRIGPPEGDLTLGHWNRFYREALRSLEEADTEETLGTQGLYPLHILQSIHQEKFKTDSWADELSLDPGEDITKVQEYLEALSGTSPAQQHISTEDR
jgi:hypothetical protein